MVNDDQAIKPQHLQKVLETGIVSVEIPETISIEYALLGCTSEKNWNPGKEYNYEDGVKTALKRRAPGFAKDTSGTEFHSTYRMFVTDNVSIPGFRLIYVHPSTTETQKAELFKKLHTAPKDSPAMKLVEVPNPALFNAEKLSGVLFR